MRSAAILAQMINDSNASNDSLACALLPSQRSLCEHPYHELRKLLH
jgi:hypothetical protein